MTLNDPLGTNFKWPFKHFMKDVLQIQPEIQLDSDDFALNQLPESKFHLTFVPLPDNKTGMASLWLIADELGGAESIHTTIEFSIEHANGIKIGATNGSFIFNADNLMYGFEKYISRADLGKFTTTVGKSNVTYLCCKIIHYLSSEKCETPQLPKKKEDPVPEAIVPAKIEDDLRKKFWEMYQEGIYDCTIEVGDTQFKLLKGILMSQSPVFKKTFEATMGQCSFIQLSEAVNVDAMKKMFEWMYIGNLIDAEDLLEDLYRLAVKYEILLLKEECLSMMRKTLDLTNVYARNRVGTEHKEDRLINATKSFLDGVISQCASTDTENA